MVWKKQPWGIDITFKQFCEYILPYRVGNERPDYDRMKIYNQFNGLLDSVCRVNGDAISVCSCINNDLIRRGWHKTFSLYVLPHFSAQRLINEHTGTCRVQSDLTVHVRRALVDRLTHNAHLVNMNGDSYRLRETTEMMKI